MDYGVDNGRKRRTAAQKCVHTMVKLFQMTKKEEYSIPVSMIKLFGVESGVFVWF